MNHRNYADSRLFFFWETPFPTDRVSDWLVLLYLSITGQMALFPYCWKRMMVNSAEIKFLIFSLCATIPAFKKADCFFPLGRARDS